MRLDSILSSSIETGKKGEMVANGRPLRYEYYFEKDVKTEHFFDTGGHRHDWENVVVFVQDGEVKGVAASQHGGYESRAVEDVRMQGEFNKLKFPVVEWNHSESYKRTTCENDEL